MNNKRKVAIYCRVGKEQELEIKKQEERAKKYCEVNGYEIYKSYIDIGYSANDCTRPGYNSMLEDMILKNFDLILVINFNSISNSIIELEKVISFANKHNCSIVSVNDKVDTFSTNFFPGLLSLFAKLDKSLRNE